MAGEYRWHLLPVLLRQRRDRLIIQLGGKCQQCGLKDFDELEFHHPYGKDWRSAVLSRGQRLTRYESDARAGLVILLCDDCHNSPEDHPDFCFCPSCRSSPDF